MQGQQFPPQHPENIVAYFCSNSHPRLVFTIICTSIVAILCLAFLINGKAPTFALALLGICFVVGGVCIYIIYRDKKKRPTDKEYDRWLRGEINRLYNEKFQMLAIDPQEITDAILFFRSYVLPCQPQAQDSTVEQIYLKEGKDGKLRSNITLYTYFIPTQYFVGIIIFDINALQPKQHDSRYYQYNRPYAYRSLDMPEIKLIEDQRVFYNGMYCPCRMEVLTLTMKEGMTYKTIDMTATVRATLYVEGEPIHLNPTRQLEEKVNRLRRLFIEHNK